jgi:8-oxo-dGTP pyrophosphatase MutT (NUDIX family)
MTERQDKHSSDIYGDNIESQEETHPAIPAATVVLLRDAPTLEVLMLHKTSKISFGGMWVFPGGRIDPEDHPESGDMDQAARNAAARETREEAGLISAPDSFIYFSHWTPPPSTPKRFSTWFFASLAEGHDVEIDGGEIQDHQWLQPAEALQRHSAGEIDLAPPTWITLYQLSLAHNAQAALQRLSNNAPRVYETRLGKISDGTRVAMWHGDAGYEAHNPNAEGERHRLVMSAGGFQFENTVTEY